MRRRVACRSGNSRCILCVTTRQQTIYGQMPRSCGPVMAQAVTFGPFRLLPAQRMLFEEDRPLRLGNRAIDILIALADSAGDLVGKDELIARVWPKTIV